MNILWTHEVSYKKKPVYEYQDFPERLSARGHSVRVVDFDETDVVHPGDIRISRTGTAEITLSSTPHSNFPVLKYFQAKANYRSFLDSELKRGVVDAAFVYSVFINGTETVRRCKQYGVPVIYRVLDAYHRLRPGMLTQKILHSGERYIYRNVDRILVTNEKMIDYVCEVAGQNVTSKVIILDHGVDTSHFMPRPPDGELMKRFGLEAGDQVALFLGTTYAFSGLDELIKHTPEIIKRLPRFKLLIVGGGELDATLLQLVSDLDLTDRVLLTGMVPYHDVVRYLSLAKLALNPFDINDITRDIIPIKILQYLAAGLPVLSTPLPDLRRKFAPPLSGVKYTESASPDQFADLMVSMLSEPGRLLEQGAVGQHFVTHHYSVERAVEGLESTFEELCCRSRKL